MLTLGFHCWHLFSEWPCVRLKKVSTWMTSWTNRQLWHGILRLVNPLTALSFQLDWFAWQSRALWMSQWKRHRSALPLPRQRNRTVEGSSTRETVNSATGCNSNQVQEAIRSIRQWAAFRAFKEAKAAGRETFTVEDWHRWMAVHLRILVTRSLLYCLLSTARVMQLKPNSDLFLHSKCFAISLWEWNIWHGTFLF